MNEHNFRKDYPYAGIRIDPARKELGPRFACQSGGEAVIVKLPRPMNRVEALEYCAKHPSFQTPELQAVIAEERALREATAREPAKTGTKVDKLAEKLREVAVAEAAAKKPVKAEAKKPAKAKTVKAEKPVTETPASTKEKMKAAAARLHAKVEPVVAAPAEPVVE